MVAALLLACVFYSGADRDRDSDGVVAIAFGGADCDDEVPTVHPGATEVCNAVDDDCDGSADIGATDGTVWYFDVDGDGYGSEEVLACEESDGIAAINGDCDDSDAAVNPGAVDDVCTTEAEDCDGANSPDGAEANARLGGEAGGTSGIGLGLATGQQDSVGEVLVAGSADAGSVLVFALSEGTEQKSADSWARLDGGGGPVAFGDAFVTDADQDDLFVGDPGYDGGRGRLGIFQLAETGGEHAWDNATAIWEGEAEGQSLGATLLFFEGDATSHSSMLFIGAPATDEGRGRVYILQLTASGQSGTLPVADNPYAVVAAAHAALGAGLGSSLGGWADSGNALWGVYGAPGEQSDRGTEAGTFFMAAVGGPIDVHEHAVQRYVGSDGGDRFATAIAFRDIDSDGIIDLLVSAPGRDTDAGEDAGAVYLLPGTVLEANTAVADTYELSEATLVIEGDGAGRGLGRALSLTDDGRLRASAWSSSCTDGDPGVVYTLGLDGSGIRIAEASDVVAVGEPGAELGASLLEGVSGTWVGEPGLSQVERFFFP